MVNYVLVPNDSVSPELEYYEGYFKDNQPCTTKEYTKAAKFCYKDESENLCAIINEIKHRNIGFHVEEHAYFDK